MPALRIEVPPIHFNMMPDSVSMASYGDKLIVYDNISTPLSETYTAEVESFIRNFPVKVEFTVVIFVLEGRLDIGCNLQQYSISPGEVMVVVPGSVGESVSIAPDSKLIVLSLADSTSFTSGTVRSTLFSAASFVRPVKFAIEHELIWPVVQEYQHLKRAVLSEKYVNDNLVSSYISVLSCYAAMSMSKWNESPGDGRSIKKIPGSKLFNKFLELLEVNYIDHKDVAFYADACCLSPKYFSRQIFAASGKHPIEWIKARVVLNAQAMLHSGEYSIAQIADSLKFSSQSAFNRYFKDETGMTPSEYQKQ